MQTYVQLARNPALALVVVLTAAIVWTPPFVSFGFAVAAAICWCIWLERHPTA
jgi:hypothetical protein